MKYDLYNCWKQPVPIALEQDSRIDLLTKLMFSHIVLNCRNRDDEIDTIVWNGNKMHRLQMKRGQMILNLSSFTELGIPKSRVRRTLTTLQRYINLNISRKSYGLLVTVVEYDEISKMENSQDNNETTKRQQKENKSPSNTKSVKNEENDKSVKEEKIYSQETAKEILKHYNEVNKTSYTSISSFQDNLNYWLKTYSIEDIRKAISVIPNHSFWKDKMKLSTLFRKKNPNREDVDYIGDLLNYKAPEGKLGKNSRSAEEYAEVEEYSLEDIIQN
jgi:hypothetical protein